MKEALVLPTVKRTRAVRADISFFKKLSENIGIHKGAYIMILPLLAFYIIFCYAPMYGAVIAFKDFSPKLGIMGSRWVGLKNFSLIFSSPNFFRALVNTLTVSVSTIIFSFPAPIILAIFINELKNRAFSRTVQTISYLPHFISLVVICGMIKDFTLDSGFINDITAFFGLKRQTMLNSPGLFVPIYVISDIWQEAGWGSIVYLAALMGIDPMLYEAADIDGAGRFRKIFNITLPGIAPTVIIMLILRLGNLLGVGYEKIILLYNPVTYEKADVISSFVYRRGIQEMDWSFSTAVGLFNSVINFTVLGASNLISRKTMGSSLW
jgi:putative aldouronate transport system permease protein